MMVTGSSRPAQLPMLDQGHMLSHGGHLIGRPLADGGPDLRRNPTRPSGESTA